MTKRIYIIILMTLLVSAEGIAQNLVNNPSFEQTISCPYAGGFLTNGCAGWKNFGSIIPNYFNSCNTSPNYSVPNNTFGIQAAAEGNAYIGLYTYVSSIVNSKEYVTNTMAPMTPGTHYEVSMSVSLADNSGFATNDLAVYFFDKAKAYYPIHTSLEDSLPQPPQVSYANYGTITNKNMWKRLSKIYVADSAYDNIAIGGFRKYANMTLDTVSAGNFAYYYIDSIVVRKVLTSITFNDTSLCQNETITVPFSFYSGSYFNPGNVFKLELSDKNGSFAKPTVIGTLASTQPGSIVGIIPGSLSDGSAYRVKVVSTDPVDSSTDNGIDIGIHPIPVPVASPNSSLCEGDTLMLFASCTTPVSTYKWYGPLVTGAIANPYIVNGVTSAYAGEYQVRAQYFDCYAFDTVFVSVKPKPTNIITSINSPVCEDGTLILNGSSGTAGVNYLWEGPGNFTSTLKDPVKTNISMTDSGYYKFSAILNGCAAKDSVHLSVLTKPKPQALVNSPVCEGDSLVFYASETVPGETYRWNGVSNFSASTKTAVLKNVNFSATGKYVVAVTAAGCIGYDSVEVNVKPMPAYPVGAVNTPICEGDSLRLNVTNINTSVNYRWEGPAGYKANGAQAMVSKAVPAQSGNYIVIANLNNCERYDTISARVKPLPDTPNIFSNSPLQTGQNLYIEMKNPQSGVLYAWNGPNGFTSQAINPVIYRPGLVNSGIYSVVATLEGCTSSNSILVEIVESVDTGYILLTPTINNGAFKIRALLKQEQQVPIRIFDAAGHEVYYDVMRTDKKRVKSDFDLSGRLSSGMYIVHIMADGKKHVMRFVVDR